MDILSVLRNWLLSLAKTLDGVQVLARGRQEAQVDAGTAQGLPAGMALVAVQAVPEDVVAGLDRRDQDPLRPRL